MTSTTRRVNRQKAKIMSQNGTHLLEKKTTISREEIQARINEESLAAFKRQREFEAANQAANAEALECQNAIDRNKARIDELQKDANQRASIYSQAYTASTTKIDELEALLHERDTSGE